MVRAVRLLRAEHELGKRQREERRDRRHASIAGRIARRIAAPRGARAFRADCAVMRSADGIAAVFGISVNVGIGRAAGAALAAPRSASAASTIGAECRGRSGSCQMRAQNHLTAARERRTRGTLRTCAMPARRHRAPRAAAALRAVRRTHRRTRCCASPVPRACRGSPPPARSARCPRADGAICGACLRDPPPYAATVAALVYAFPDGPPAPADQVRRQHRARRLGRCDARRGGAARGSPRAPPPIGRISIVALPLSAPRQRERGFNQARRDRRARRARNRAARSPRRSSGFPADRRRRRCRGRSAAATSAARSRCAATSAARGSRSSTT